MIIKTPYSMKEQSITIRSADSAVIACRCAIIIPASAVIEAGHIRTLTTDSAAHSKHQFHAMTQIALFQFQEGELEVGAACGPLIIQWKDETETIAAGVVLCLDSQGDLHLVGNPAQNVSKLLQLAHRFCTRWVRLDI